jgi:hypothetical protein
MRAARCEREMDDEVSLSGLAVTGMRVFIHTSMKKGDNFLPPPECTLGL